MITISEKDNELFEWSYECGSQDYLLGLLRTTSLDERLRKKIENEINDIENMNKEDYDRIVFNLFSNQLDPISSGISYNQGDILKHLRKLK